MNKNFKFGLAFFAMLLVSAVCFADVSPKDKKCEGAWVDENGKGYYFNKGKIYLITGGMWFSDWEALEVNDDSFVMSGMEDSIAYIIKSINGNTMVLEGFNARDLILSNNDFDLAYSYGEEICKKASKVPPKSKKSYFDYLDERYR